MSPLAEGLKMTQGLEGIMRKSLAEILILRQNRLMRVISGQAGGLMLQSPKGGGTRPTQDKVRAAIFSSLGALVEGSRWIDLYAGSGAVGIEALSRGAAQVTFVEKHRPCLDTIRKNLTSTRLSENALVVGCETFSFLRGESQPRDIIFADPPYELYQTSIAGQEFALALMNSCLPLLPQGALLLLESSRRTQIIPATGYSLLQEKIYGDAKLTKLLRTPSERERLKEGDE